MAEQELGKFKGALFGGFNRRSVAEYMEVLLKERNDYRDRLEESELLCEALRGELEVRQQEDEEIRLESDWKQEKETLNAAVQESRARADALESDLRAMAGRLREVCLELNDKRSQLETVNTQLIELQGQLESTCQAAKANSDLRSELEALREDAREKAEAAEQSPAPRPGAESDARVQELCRGYGDFREDLLSTMDYLRRQLGRLDARLAEVDRLQCKDETAGPAAQRPCECPVKVGDVRILSE